jgi:cardiolipin synthase
VIEGLVSLAIALHVLGAAACTVHVLSYYRSPTPAVAWVFAVWVLPLLGSLAYVSLAVYEGPRRVRRRRRAALGIRRGRGVPQAVERSYERSLDDPGFVKIVENVCPFALTRGNAVEIYPDGQASFDAMFECLAGAREEILLETYIFRSGRIQERLSHVLSERARAGVAVRLLIDPIGSLSLKGRVLRELAAAGVRTETFLAPNPLLGRFRINFRNHRKLLVVDRQVAFTGGRNWSDEYCDRDGRPPDAVRDLWLRIVGPTVPRLRRIFEEDWSIATGAELEPWQPPSQWPAAGELAVRTLPQGGDEPTLVLPAVLGAAFRSARKSILIVTPYFVPGETMAEHLRLAALGGVQVVILIPHRSDVRMIDLASRYYFEPLLRAGAEIWLRRPPFLHAKAVIVDGTWSTVGSANFDQRSLRLNYELNVEVLGEEFATRLRQYFTEDFAAAERVDPLAFARRPAWRRLRERAAALFEPVL